MKFGLEKEALIFDQNIKPYQLDENLFDKNTSLDFCDHQMELITDTCPSIISLHEQINQLCLTKYPEDSYVWPISPINCNLEYTFNHPALTAKDYHAHLAKTYDIKMLLTSGIHFNVSGFSSPLHEMAKKLYVFSPLILVFFAFSPKDEHQMFSSRNTNKYGYYNEQNFDLDFSSTQNYYAYLDVLVKEGKIKDYRELYSRIRIKNSEYLELRFIDLNPYYLTGISYEQLCLLEAFIKFLDTVELKEFDFKQAVANFDDVASFGHDPNLELTINGITTTLYEHVLDMLKKMRLFNEVIIDEFIDSYQNQDTQNLRFYKEVKDYNFDLCKWAVKHLFHYKHYVDPFPDLNLELSSKLVLKSAIEMGLETEILSVADNILTIAGKYFIQATKTNIDGYANILLMENKHMTKYILDRAGIKTPKGIRLSKTDSFIDTELIGKKLMVKPLDTNFGLGINLVEPNQGSAGIDHALKEAFKYSNQVIVEEFVEGKEYRFLVIDGQCVSVLQRVEAYVIGDGKHTINELITLKNNHPLRGTAYSRPLEKILIDDNLLEVLKQQGYDINTVVDKDKRVLLRNNSNVSTGGETIELSNVMPQYFKDIAIRAAAALDVRICGIDMMIEDIYDYNYAIIEANFNPALHIHAYPLIGIGRDVSRDVINTVLKYEKN